MDIMEDSPTEITSEIWEQYVQAKDLASRNRLFHHYSPWIKKIVSVFFLNHKGISLDWGDCMQNASISLIEAIERFDPSRGVPFEGYAYIRIKGTLLNFYTSYSQSQRKLDRFEEDQIVDESSEDVDFDYFLDAVIEAAFSELLLSSSNQLLISMSDPLDAYIFHQEGFNLNNAIDRLDENLKFIIVSHYQHFISFTKIAETLGVSRSRVSQLHRESLRKLRLIYEGN